MAVAGRGSTAAARVRRALIAGAPAFALMAAIAVGHGALAAPDPCGPDARLQRAIDGLPPDAACASSSGTASDTTTQDTPGQAPGGGFDFPAPPPQPTDLSITGKSETKG